MPNRHERRTRGREIIKQLHILRNCKTISDADLKDIPEEDIKLLSEHSHPNKALQLKYDKAKKVLEKLTLLEIELKYMQKDLQDKVNSRQGTPR